MLEESGNVTPPRSAHSNIPALAVCIGTIVAVEANGDLLIDFPGNILGPIAARTALPFSFRSSHADLLGHQVVVTFENNDPALPVVIGRIAPLAGGGPRWTAGTANADEPDDLTVEHKVITFNATQKVVFNCGKASITLTDTGKVILKGEYILSQSYGENRIRGGSVAIN